MSLIPKPENVTKLFETSISLLNNLYAMSVNLQASWELQDELKKQTVGGERQQVQNEINRLIFDSEVLLGKIFADVVELSKLATSIYGISGLNNAEKMLSLWQQEKVVQLNHIIDITADITAALASAGKAPIRPLAKVTDL